jgi:hypothetical protein
MIRRLSILLSLLLAAAVAHADDTAPNPAALAAQPITRDGISLKLPANWTVDPPPANTPNARPAPLVARAPLRDRDDTGEFQTVLIISTDTGSDFDAAAQQTRLANDRSFSNYKPVETPTATRIANTDAVTFGGTFTLGPLKLRSQQYMLTRNNKIYVITVTALESQWDKYRPAFDAAIHTLTLNDAK